MGEKRVEDDSVLEQKLYIPDYISLKEKYKCDTCKLNEKNVPYHHGFLQSLKYIFSTCNGEPCRRTQCKKRCWVFSDLFCLGTTAIIVSAFFCIFSHFQDLMLSLACTIIFAILMDLICCFIEYVVDKIFENIERLRRKSYDKKVADIEAINQEKMRESEKRKEKEAEIYKDINEAKELFSSLSNEYFDRLKDASDKAKMTKAGKKSMLNLYKELLKNIKTLLEQINLENFYFTEIKVFFQIHLPKLMECITIYIESIENEKETTEQIEELVKLLETFNNKVIWIQENLNNSDAENLIFQMQALREVVSNAHYKEDEK